MSRIRFISVLAGACVACIVSCGDAGTFRERVREYHVLHYALDLCVNEQNRSVSGTVTMRLVLLHAMSALEVDAGELDVQSVAMRGAGTVDMQLHYRVVGERVEVTLPHALAPSDTIFLSIAYAAHPRTGLFFVLPDSGYPDLPSVIWSQGEMEQNHYWFPCYDYPNDKASSEMRVTVNDRFMAVSNGALLSVTHDQAGKTATYFWYQAKPMASYLISLVAGEYVQIADWYKKIPVEYNVYPRQRDDAMRSFSQTPDMMRFFSDRTGFDYPWAKYAQTVVPDFTYGGMENTSAATLTDATIHSARAHRDVQSEGLVAHELAHQWFGDLLTCRSWSHAWLNEGFATFFQTLYDEMRLGRDAYDEEMMEHQEAVMESDRGASRRATVTNTYADPEDVFDTHIYARGACLLHMLRFVIGEQKFWDGIRHYVDLNQYQCVETDDFRRAMEDVSGQDLRWFFDEWAVRAGYPELTVVPLYDSAATVVHLDIVQTQQVDSLTPLYRMPVAVEVCSDSGSVMHTVMMKAVERQRIDIPCPHRPENIVFDKGNWILKSIAITKPVPMWLYQLQHGGVAERRGALSALAHMISSPEVLSAVAELIHHDPFWSVRRQAAELVAASGAEDALRLLAPAFNDPDSRVRVAATAGLKHFQTLDALVALGNLFAHDSSEAVVAEALVSLTVIDSAHAMSYCEKGLSMVSNRDIIRAAAVRAMGPIRTAAAKARLITLTRYGESPEVRVAAIDALADHWWMDAAAKTAAEQLVQDRNFQVQRKAVERLAAFEDVATVRRMLNDIVAHEIQPLLRREARRSLARLNARAPGH